MKGEINETNLNNLYKNYINQTLKSTNLLNIMNTSTTSLYQLNNNLRNQVNHNNLSSNSNPQLMNIQVHNSNSNFNKDTERSFVSVNDDKDINGGLAINKDLEKPKISSNFFNVNENIGKDNSNENGTPHDTEKSNESL
jgi:hypothetical protein